MRDAIELGIACFLAAPTSSDEALVARLEALGVAPWLARRLVIWLPIAFGRTLFPEVAFGGEYVMAGERLRFDDDPVWSAIQVRAPHATRDELQAIALRSAEVKAINTYLTKMDERGQEPDLTALRTTNSVSIPFAPIEAGDGGVPEPREAFHGFIAAHGLPPSTVAACDANVFPRITDERFSLIVEFAVTDARLAGGRVLETFAGMGASYRSAVGDAVRKFERGSVHVLIAGLFDETMCREQVEWERWSHPSGERRVCLGGQLVLYGPGAPTLGPLLDRMREALARVPLRADAIHALRIFTARQAERAFGTEVLLDGETWDEGEALCANYEWPHIETLWGTRLFALLLPG